MLSKLSMEGAGGVSGEVRKRKSEGCEGSSSGSGVVTQVREKEEEEERMRNRQLKELKPVVVLKRLRADEIAMLVGEREEEKAVQEGNLFPPEIMEMVLDNLEDPKDLVNCSRAVPLMSEILTPRKPTYLFNQVVPHLLGYISFNDMKTCRLACSDWKRGVNKLIQNRPSVRPYNDESFLMEKKNPQTRLNFGVTPYSQLKLVTKIKTDWLSLENFMASSDRLFGRGNPFLGRTVEFLVETFPEDEVLLQNFPEMFLIFRSLELRTFLAHVGHHIQHLRFKSENIAPLIEARLLDHVLTSRLHCHNLRSISIDMSQMEGDIILPGRESIFARQADRILAVRHSRLPELHTIEVVSVRDITMPSIGINAIVTPYLPQLRKLTLPCFFDVRAAPFNWPIINPLPHLKELRIDKITSNEILERLTWIEGAPIEKLILKFSYGDLNLETLLRVVRAFPLRNLELLWTGGPFPNIRAPDEAQVLPAIPSLHTLKMTNSVEVNYSFLKSFPNLQHLYLEEELPANGPPLHSRPPLRVMKRISGREDIQVHKYLYGGSLDRSNVWEVFPSLKIVAFERTRKTQGSCQKWKQSWGRPEKRRRAMP